MALCPSFVTKYHSSPTEMPRRSSRLKSVISTALDPLAPKQDEVNGVVQPWKWQVGDALYLHFPEGDVNDPANIALCEVTRPPGNPHLIGPKAKLSTCQLDWLAILKGEDSGGVGWTEETTLELFLRRLPSEEAKEEYERIVKERKEEVEGEGEGEDISFVGIIDETQPTLEGEPVLAATTPKPQNPQTPQLNVSPADEVKRSQSQSASQPLSQLNRKVLVLPSQGGENGTPFSASPASKTPPKKYLGKINEEEEVVEEKKKNKRKRKPELEPEPESEEAPPPKKKKKKGKVYVGPSAGALIKAEFTGKQNDGQVKKIFCGVVTSVGHDKRGPFGMVEYVDGEEWKTHWEAGQKWEDATQGDIDRETDMIAAAAAAAEEDESEDDDESGDGDGEVVATARVSKKRTILSAESDSVDSSQRNTQNNVDSIVGNQESGDEVEVVAETEDLQESSDDEIALFASQLSDKLKDKLNNELNDELNDDDSSSSSSIPAIGSQLVVGSQPNFSQVSTPDVVGGPPTTGEKPAPPLPPHANATLTSPQPQSQESTQDSIVIDVDENPNVGSPPRGWGAGDDSSGSDGSSH